MDQVTITVNESTDDVLVTVVNELGGANLSATYGASTVTVNSDTGVPVVLAAATDTLAGVFTAADKVKLGGIATAATANSPDATLLARANHTGTQSADTLTDGTTNKAFLATERTKLAAISGTNTGDQTISISGDVTASGSTGVLTSTVTKINGTALSGLSTGILKNTTSTGVPSIAVAADFPTLNQDTTGTAVNFSGSLLGDVTGTQSATVVGSLNGTSLASLSTGILKNTTLTGVPSIAVAGDFPTLNQNTTGTAANVTGIVLGANGGTGVANTSKTITLGGNLTTSGAFATTLTSTATTNITLPSTGVLATVDQIVGMKNRLINGYPIVDQRNSGASQTITAAAALAYTVDRWYAYCTGANITGQQVQVSGLYRYKFTGAASNTAVGFGQRIEARNCADLAGTTATLQVKLSSSSLTSITWTAYYANTTDTFGTLASPTRTSIGTGTFTINSTEATYSAQIAVSASATTGIEIVFTGGALLAAQTLTIGDVQLEAGSVATPFERRDYESEFARCQRYFCKSYDDGINPGAISTNGEVRYVAPGTGGESAPTVYYKVSMRSSPAVTWFSAATGTSGKRRNYTSSADETVTGANVAGSNSFSGSSGAHTASSIYGFQYTAVTEL